MYKTAKFFYPDDIQHKDSVTYLNCNDSTEHKTEKHIKVSEKQFTQELRPIEIRWEKINNVTTSNPIVWGPAFWFTLHNCASKYPIKATPLYVSKMKDFISSIPYILPCEICKVHANIHIDNNKNNLNDICSGREKLFNFFVEFHNIVNKRYGKKEMSNEDAYKIYNGTVNIVKMVY